jgi:hypothetical protein
MIAAGRIYHPGGVGIFALGHSQEWLYRYALGDNRACFDFPREFAWR